MSEYRATIWMHLLPNLKSSKQFPAVHASILSSERLERELGTAIFYAMLEADHEEVGR